MLRSILAVVGGFVTMAIVVMAGTFALVATMVPGGLATMRGARDGTAGPPMPVPTPRYLALNVAMSFAAALFAGWVTTRIAATAPMAHLLALSALILVMGAASGRAPSAKHQPAWYRIAIPLVGVAGVLSSGLFVRSVV